MPLPCWIRTIGRLRSVGRSLKYCLEERPGSRKRVLHRLLGLDEYHPSSFPGAWTGRPKSIIACRSVRCRRLLELLRQQHPLQEDAVQPYDAPTQSRFLHAEKLGPNQTSRFAEPVAQRALSCPSRRVGRICSNMPCTPTG